MKPAGDNNMIHFDGFMDNSLYGMGSALESIMDTRVSDIFNTIEGPPNLIAWNKAHPQAVEYKFIPKTPIILGVKHSAKKGNYYHTNSLSKDFIAYQLANKDSVTIIAMGLNADNVHNYRYHVVVDDNAELVPWSVPALQQQYGAKKAYGFLGKFHAPGKEVAVEVVNINNYGIRDGVVLNWRNNLKPVMSKIIGFKKGKIGTVVNLSRRQPLVLNADTLGAVNIYFKDHQTLPYDIYWVMGRSKYRIGTDTVLIKSGLRENYFSFTNQYFTTEGNYKILVYPVGTKDKNRETTIEFNAEDTSAYKKGYTVLQLLPYLLLALLAFGIYYLFSKRRLRNLGRQKEMANLKLGSVRAQLNPHFMFNALTSIQNLINQQDSNGANHYLTKFADLTRQVLNATSKELISLEDELKIVDDYLQIEKLRFGFTYSIDIDKSINIANTEIPGMLMQPFIENAAKHGINGMANKGKISIAIAKQQNNLLLTIADNGKGFDTQANITTGFGLKLGRERIALLNQIYKNQPIKLQIHSDANGTTITILLTAWL